MSKQNFDMQEVARIWTHPQFLVADVCKVTGATPKALEHLVNSKRNLVRLVGPHVNPGTGRRRIFSGGQVLMIAAAFAMTRIGFPQRFVRTLADEVERRALWRSHPHGNLQTGLMIVTYPMNSGDDWALTRIYNEMEKEPEAPVAVHVLDVDRLIDQVTAQLTAIIEDEDVPDFMVPDPQPAPNLYSPASNFMKLWKKDDSGNWCYVGLTLEETHILMKDEGIGLDGDDLIYFDSVRNDDRKLIWSLMERRENARFEVLDEIYPEDAT